MHFHDGMGESANYYPHREAVLRNRNRNRNRRNHIILTQEEPQPYRILALGSGLGSGSGSGLSSDSCCTKNIKLNLLWRDTGWHMHEAGERKKNQGEEKKIKVTGKSFYRKK